MSRYDYRFSHPINILCPEKDIDELRHKTRSISSASVVHLCPIPFDDFEPDLEEYQDVTILIDGNGTLENTVKYLVKLLALSNQVGLLIGMVTFIDDKGQEWIFPDLVRPDPSFI